MTGTWLHTIPRLALCFLVPLAATAQAGGGATAAQYAAAGQQAAAQGRYAEAQVDFENLAKLEPGVAEVHATLAAIYFKQREYTLAVQEIRTAQRLKPALPKLDSLLGLSLSEQGNFSQALPYLEKGFRQTADPEVRRMCGLELLHADTELHRDAEAVETSLAMNRFYPNDPEVLYHTGRIYGNFAWIVMEKLHDTAPNSIWMLQAQGEADESQKDYDAAIIAFNHVLELDPHRLGIHYRLGRVYLARFRDTRNASDRDAAMREFSAELTVDPQNGNAGYELANIQAETGNLEAARQQFALLLRQFPDFEEALVGLAGIDLTSQKAADAVPLLEHATRLRPDDEVAWWRLAQAERAVGDQNGQTQALAHFRKIHTTIPVTLRKPNAVDDITPQQIDGSAQP